MDPRKAAMCAVFIAVLMWTNMAAQDCSKVTQQLSACLPFLLNGSPMPSHNSPCCTGVQNIYSATTSTQARRNVCECIEAAATAYNLNDNALKNLAPDCGVQLPFTISKTMDCNSVQ